MKPHEKKRIGRWLRVSHKVEQAKVVIVSAQVESELVELSEEERKDFLGSLGVEEGGLK